MLSHDDKSSRVAAVEKPSPARLLLHATVSCCCRRGPNAYAQRPRMPIIAARREWMGLLDRCSSSRLARILSATGNMFACQRARPRWQTHTGQLLGRRCRDSMRPPGVVGCSQAVESTVQLLPSQGDSCLGQEHRHDLSACSLSVFPPHPTHPTHSLHLRSPSLVSPQTYPPRTATFLRTLSLDSMLFAQSWRAIAQNPMYHPPLQVQFCPCISHTAG